MNVPGSAFAILAGRIRIVGIIDHLCMQVGIRALYPLQPKVVSHVPRALLTHEVKLCDNPDHHKRPPRASGHPDARTITCILETKNKQRNYSFIGTKEGSYSERAEYDPSSSCRQTAKVRRVDPTMMKTDPGSSSGYRHSHAAGGHWLVVHISVVIPTCYYIISRLSCQSVVQAQASEVRVQTSLVKVQLSLVPVVDLGPTKSKYFFAFRGTLSSRGEHFGYEISCCYYFWRPLLVLSIF